MSLRVDLVEAPADGTKAVEFLTGEFLPLVEEFWQRRGREFFRVDHWKLQALDFTQLWMDQRVILVMAYEDDKPAGFILAAQIQPLFYPQRQLHVDQWYDRSQEIEEAMFQYLLDHIKFLQVDALLVPDYGGKNPACLCTSLMRIRCTKVWFRS
jgi:hypothetical protein